MIPNSCLPPFENDLRRRVGQGSLRGHVRNPTIVAVSLPLTTRSKEAADYRCYKDVPRCGQRVNRRFSSPQIVFGRHHRAHQTLRRAFPLSSAPNLLTESLQQSKDVEDKLADLILWLTKLKDSATLASADGDHKEAERREQLKQCVQLLRRPADPGKQSVVPWKISRVDLKHC